MPIWVRVVIALVLGATGAAWVVCVSRRDPPTDATDQRHAEQIRAVLNSVDTALKDGSPSNLAESEAAIITSHFPELARQATAWDTAANRVAVSKQALRASAESELRKLQADKPPYNFDSICDGLCTITEAHAANPEATAQPFPPMIGNESDTPTFLFFCSATLRVVFLEFNGATGVTGDLVRLEGDNYPGDAAHEIDEKYGRSIYNFLLEMQTWNPTKNLILKRRELEGFDRVSLERAVENERGKSYYRRAQGCPGCN
jgi:hypothetical protein